MILEKIKNVLIIEKNEKLGRDIEDFFKNKGYNVKVVTQYVAAKKILNEQSFDILITDIDSVKSHFYHIIEQNKGSILDPMIIVSAELEKVREAVKIVKNGAVDYVRKPFDMYELELKIDRAIKLKRLKNETDNLRGDRNIIYKTENFIGESPAIKKVFEIVSKVAKSNSSVLLTGETGTGKELVAGAIHYNSNRKDKAFVKVNCAALPEQLLESELFGHVKGAFTGAERTRIGRFEQADGGTIFLDEVGDLSPTTQAKLLRVIQEREFQRIGDNKTIKVDVRIISATNKDLVHEVNKGRFRSDLFFRLNVVNINIPPLRERRGDIILLTYFFLKKYSKELKKEIKEIHPLAIKHLTEYSWPGNIRELENVIERAILMADGDVIKPEDLYLPFKKEFVNWDYNNISIPLNGINLEEVERHLVIKALKMCDYIQKDAAKLLGISQRVLNYKIKRFGITHPRWKVNK